MLNNHSTTRLLACLRDLRNAENETRLSAQYAYVGGRIDQLLCSEIVDHATWKRLCELKHNAYSRRCYELAKAVMAAA